MFFQGSNPVGVRVRAEGCMQPAVEIKLPDHEDLSPCKGPSPCMLLSMTCATQECNLGSFEVRVRFSLLHLVSGVEGEINTCVPCKCAIRE